MYYIIMNPSSKSGQGPRIWKQLEPVFQERKIPYRLMLSTHNGHVAELAAEVTSAGTPVNLIILGGDGTVNEALQGIRDFSNVNIGFIPTGSGNDLARDMRLGKDPLKILESILREDISRKVDLGRLTVNNSTGTVMKKDGADAPDERFFVVSSGIGFDAAVCEEALSSRLKDVLNKIKLGKLTYLGIALKQLIAAKHVSCDLYLDDKAPVHLNRFLFSAFMIHRYEGGGFKFCPDADAGDGLLDICLVGHIPKPVILLALPTAFFGKHYLFPQIFHYRASRIEIRTSAPLWVHTDGEVRYKADHICLSCEKQKARFLA
ncbi:MAG: YegS/Rv2252/BmrU family lipid kinase [Blautia sp.]|nr:YegS/Rv2252/BmrU family lipid kinase [Blautia sp.]MCM1202188.1 YegS/Rv2252/BmrU family lipid kinase [Bacteroides fragilis]